MSRRALAALIGNLILVGLIVLGFGLDWRAALWASPMDEPAPPARSQYPYVVVERH